MIEEGINVLSLFDGMSCGHLGLDDAQIKVNQYIASEIDKPAITVTQDNYPNTKQVGDVRNVHIANLGIEIDNQSLSMRVIEVIPDLLIGGSPCQSFSFLGKKKGMSTKEKMEITSLDQYLELKSMGWEFEGQSYLFWEYVRILRECLWLNPKLKFLLENVGMEEKWERIISTTLGVNPIYIDSGLVCGQTRNRLYWTNIGMKPMGLFGYLQSEISQPKPMNIQLKDILEDEVDEKYFLKEGQLNWLMGKSGQQSIKKGFTSIDKTKASCLTKRAQKSWNCNYVTKNGKIRNLTPIEYERLQTVPDNYTSAVKDSDRYEMLGNGWTVKIISHIFKYIKQ